MNVGAHAGRLARKLAWSFGVVFAVTSATFFINHAIPSDPARMIAGPRARPADVARLRVQLGLDRSILAQYGIFLRRVAHVGPARFDPEQTPAHSTCGHLGPVHLDLGRSYHQRRPVVAILAKRAPYTFVLALAATAVSVAVGVGSGLLAAVRRGTWLDTGAIVASVIGLSTPTFILGVVLQYFFAYRLGVLPLNGAGEGVGGGAIHLILPALTLGLYFGAFYTRIVRSEIVELLGRDFVRTARAKGASRWRVVMIHALRNALLPIVTMIGLDLGALIGGAVIVEALFAWPGIGSLAVRSMLDRDGPIIMGTVLLSATAIVAANVLVDLTYALLDPRTRAR